MCSSLVQVLVSQGHIDEARSYLSLIKGVPDRSPKDYYEMGTLMEGICYFDEAGKEDGQAVEKTRFC